MASQQNDNTEQQILDAAHDVFIEKGMQAAKMQDIADKAGIKRTVVNYYFRTKEKLYKKVARAIIQKALPMMMGVLNSDKPLEEKITAFVRNYINMAQLNPFMPGYIVNEVNRMGPEFIEEMFDKKPDISIFIAHLEREMDAGNIVRTNPHQIMLHMISMCLFPFVGKKMFMLMSGLDTAETNALLEARKTEVPRMIMAGIRPD